MPQECRHIMPSGSRCHAIALLGKSFCYYHTNLHRVEQAHLRAKPLNLGPIEDLHGIQLALTQLFNLVDNPYSDTRRIRQMIDILKVAVRIVPHTAPLSIGAACAHCGHVSEPLVEPLELAETDPRELLPAETAPDPQAQTLEGHALPGPVALSISEVVPLALPADHGALSTGS